MTDISFGVCYYIRVAGINAAGTGPYSTDNFLVAAGIFCFIF